MAGRERGDSGDSVALWVGLAQEGGGSSSSESGGWRGKRQGLLIRLEVSGRGNERFWLKLGPTWV